jgi:hypothetical protein
VTDQAAYDIKRRLDEAASEGHLTMAAIWGAVRGTAPADRWDMAAGSLQAAADAIAAAQAALAAMDKREPYCTVCAEPILHLSAGWTHISTIDHIEARQAGHEPELDWRPVGADGEGNGDAG